MKVYEGPGGSVTKGLITGFTLTSRATGRATRPTRWMKQHMARLHSALARRGYDVIANPVAAAIFWEHFLALCASPPNGLHHQAIASSPIEQIADELIVEISAHSF